MNSSDLNLGNTQSRKYGLNKYFYRQELFYSIVSGTKSIQSKKTHQRFFSVTSQDVGKGLTLFIIFYGHEKASQLSSFFTTVIEIPNIQNL